MINIASTLGRAFLLTMIASAFVSADTIVSVTGPASGVEYTIDTGTFLAPSWTQTSSYTGVSITAELAGTGSGVAYLTSGIGPGTPPANVLDSFDFTFPGATPTNLSLFSGLSLGPGTYYLLIAGATSSSQNSGWEIPSPQTFTTAPGVTRPMGYYYTSNSGGSYTDYPFDNAGEPIYSVTGTASSTPEPQTGALAGLALGMLLLTRYRTYRAACKR
jgi:hypothetical protein